MISLLLPDQVEELRTVDAAVSSLPDVESACRFLTARTASILDRPVALVEGCSRRWRTVASVGDVPAKSVVAAIEQLAQETMVDSSREVRGIRIGDLPWTCVPLHRRNKNMLALVLSGDWTLSSPLLREWAFRLDASLKQLRPGVTGAAKRGMLAAYALPRRLARARTVAHMHQTIVDACARAVCAQKASIAVYYPEQQSLTITATTGYPAVLVRQLRIRPGFGIIGSVFRTARALQVEDVRRTDEAPKRLRYRTGSFISVPLIGKDGVLGVLSVADREDGGEFSRGDLRTLRIISSVAGLALDRANAIDDANASARVAAIDSLTMLFNRRYFQTRLDEEVERARRQSSPLALLLLDVDNFKQLNDRLGHLVGDAVLRVVGEVLRRSVRVFDVCARYGGDEFAIVMPGSGPESTRQVAERIREGVEDSRPPGGPWSDDLRVTTSIGIAIFTGGTGDELIGRADQALLEAKREGRNRVHVSGAPEALPGE